MGKEKKKKEYTINQPAKIFILDNAKWSNDSKNILGWLKMWCLRAMTCFQLTKNPCSRLFMLENLPCCFFLTLKAEMVLILSLRSTWRMILAKNNWKKAYQKITYAQKKKKKRIKERKKDQSVSYKTKTSQNLKKLQNLKSMQDFLWVNSYDLKSKNPFAFPLSKHKLCD